MLQLLLIQKMRDLKPYVGKTVTIPIVGRKIKIIEDNYADPEQGTGALKITLLHMILMTMMLDKEISLEIINIFTEAGKINENAPRLNILGSIDLKPVEREF